MLKPLFFSLSLGLALSFCGASKAGHNTYASEQAPAPSAQAPMASPQGECTDS